VAATEADAVMAGAEAISLSPRTTIQGPRIWTSAPDHPAIDYPAGRAASWSIQSRK